MKIRNNEPLFVDLRANHHITLNPCMGCASRGKCDVEKYALPGDYCRSYKRKEE